MAEEHDTIQHAGPESATDDLVAASIWVLLLYDVCEEIDRDHIYRLLGTPVAYREPTFPYPIPEYLRYERPPAVESIAGRWLSERAINGRIAYHDYGVVTLQLEWAFSGTWRELVDLVARSVAESDFKRLADAVVRDRVEQLRPALFKTYPEFLDEDYYVVHLPALATENGRFVSAEQLLRGHREDIARIVRADPAVPSANELRDTLQSSMSYSPADLAVLGWNVAFVYDTPEGAAPVIQLLEYANAQLLEFRRYDEVLTGLLTKVYGILEKRSGIHHGWRLAREATRLNTIRLDVRELTEHMDNSIKFFGDVFSARLYRLAASKLGVAEYRKLVDDKLRTAHDQYLFMMDQYHQSRAFILELMIVIILIIDLVFLFRGRA